MSNVTKFVKETIKQIADWCGENFKAIESDVSTLAKKVEALEKRLEEIERKGVSYKGTHQRGVAYGRGDIVTCHGSGWVCVSDSTTGQPGQCEDWKLMIKRGRDAA